MPGKDFEKWDVVYGKIRDGLDGLDECFRSALEQRSEALGREASIKQAFASASDERDGTQAECMEQAIRAADAECEFGEMFAKVERRDKRLRELRDECEEQMMRADAAERESEQMSALAAEMEQQRDEALKGQTLLFDCLQSAEDECEKLKRDKVFARQLREGAEKGLDETLAENSRLKSDLERVTADWVAACNERDYAGDDAVEYRNGELNAAHVAEEHKRERGEAQRALREARQNAAYWKGRSESHCKALVAEGAKRGN